MDQGAIDIPDLEDSYYLNALLTHLPNSTIISRLEDFAYIPKFDYIYYLKDGQIAEEGTPKSLLQNQDSILTKEFKKTNKKLFRFTLKCLGLDIRCSTLCDRLKIKRDREKGKDEMIEG
jgi:ABC-type multidrug transport system ATPase subunit